jgi:hypothetical protein
VPARYTTSLKYVSLDLPRTEARADGGRCGRHRALRFGRLCRRDSAVWILEARHQGLSGRARSWRLLSAWCVSILAGDSRPMAGVRRIGTSIRADAAKNWQHVASKRTLLPPSDMDELADPAKRRPQHCREHVTSRQRVAPAPCKMKIRQRERTRNSEQAVQNLTPAYP